MTFRIAGEMPNTPYGETSTRSGASAAERSARSCAFAMTALRSHGTIGHGSTSKTPARKASTVLSGREGSTMPINTARGCSARTLRAIRRASPVRVQSSRQIAAGRSRSSASTSVAPDAQRIASPSPASTGSAACRSSGPAAIQMIAGGGSRCLDATCAQLGFRDRGTLVHGVCGGRHVALLITAVQPGGSARPHPDRFRCVAPHHRAV